MALKIVSIIPGMCLLIVFVRSSELSWGGVQTKKIQNVTITFEQFKFVGQNRFMGFHTKFKGVTRSECAEACSTNTKGCWTWIWNAQNGNCFIAKSTFFADDAESALHFFMPAYFLYERISPCNQNVLLCEHGSQCVPNHESKTYKCVNCLSPYDGKHCNESNTETQSPSLHQDILLGQNQSCLALHLNFGVKNGTFWIHPWKDERKIKVYCSDKGHTQVSHIRENSTTSDLTELHIRDFQNGLDLHSMGNYRAMTSFLVTLEQVIKYDFFYFSLNAGNKTYDFHIEDNSVQKCYKHLGYYLGLTREPGTRPDCLFIQTFDRNATIPQWPTSDVSPEERLYKDLILTDHNQRITFVNGRMECFGEPCSFQISVR
ncbi:uncharacterized protein [Clytia hemisphaerica]